MISTLLAICLVWLVALTIIVGRLARTRAVRPAIDLRAVVRDLIHERIGELHTPSARERLRARLAARAEKRAARSAASAAEQAKS